MMARDKLVAIEQRPGEGLALLSVYDFGQIYSSQLWCRVTARKAGECSATGVSYPAGSLVYRPIGNPGNRSMRFLATAIDASPQPGKAA